MVGTVPRELRTVGKAVLSGQENVGGSSTEKERHWWSGSAGMVRTAGGEHRTVGNAMLWGHNTLGGVVLRETDTASPFIRQPLQDAHVTDTNLWPDWV